MRRLVVALVVAFAAVLGEVLGCRCVAFFAVVTLVAAVFFVAVALRVRAVACLTVAVDVRFVPLLLALREDAEIVFAATVRLVFVRVVAFGVVAVERELPFTALVLRTVGFFALDFFAPAAFDGRAVFVAAGEELLRVVDFRVVIPFTVGSVQLVCRCYWSERIWGSDNNTSNAHFANVFFAASNFAPSVVLSAVANENETRNCTKLAAALHRNGD
ncbi:MAG: hypothetical protein N2663_01430 [Chlorobi bacterium]|nr:hypothetical protein [Chlorobiota bacterium]